MHPDLFVEMAAVQQHHWWYAARRDILSSLIGTLRLPAGASILEIGCGTGANLETLRRHGVLCAMESDVAARKAANDLNVCTVDAGSLPDAVPFADGTFDLVCLLDVLEHIADDHGALARVLRLLKPGGRLVLTVPAYQWLWSPHDTLHGHFRRYTTGRLRARVLAAGFSIDNMGYFNTLLFPVVVAVRGVRKLMGQVDKHDTGMPGNFVNRCLKAIFASERHVVAGRGGFPFGVSVVAVVRRSE